MKSIKYHIAAACIALTACGGGGGGGGSDKSFFGTWKGDLFLVKRADDNCANSSPDSITRTVVIAERTPGSALDPEAIAVVNILGEAPIAAGVPSNALGFAEGDTISATFLSPKRNPFDVPLTTINVDLTPSGDGSAEMEYLQVTRVSDSPPLFCGAIYSGQVTRE